MDKQTHMIHMLPLIWCHKTEHTQINDIANKITNNKKFSFCEENS